MPVASCFDVVIIGGGLAGTLAAILLGRRDHQVALVDFREVFPPDFRAEQLVGSQVELLSKLGLLDVVVGGVLPVQRAVAMRAGRTVSVVTAPHYGISYEDMVSGARRHLPPSVRFIQAQVNDVNLGADRQIVTLLDGSVIEARLVIMATGLGQRLLRRLGIGRTTIRAAQSLAFGFDLQVKFPEIFTSSVLVAYGERPEGAVDYLTMFTVGNRLRANLFTFGDHRDDWSKRFVQEPVEMLRQALPRVEQMTGRLQVEGKVQVRVNALTVASSHCRAGVALIGDAFQTSCPAAGTGIGRLLNDIDILCNRHIPEWLATDLMDAAKINQFYSDVSKKRCDAEALRVADYRRSLVTDGGLGWKIHRRRVAIQNLLRLLTQRKPDVVSGTAQMSADAGMAAMILPPAVRNSRQSKPVEAEQKMQ